MINNDNPTVAPTVNEQFDSVNALVHQLVHKAVKLYGGDFDDMYQYACLRTLISIQRYQGDKAKLTTWVHRTISYAMVDYQRGRLKGQSSRRSAPVEECDAVDAHSTEWHSKVIELSPVARQLLDVLLDCPEEVQQAANARGGSRRSYERAFREYAVQHQLVTHAAEFTLYLSEIKQLI